MTIITSPTIKKRPRQRNGRCDRQVLRFDRFLLQWRRSDPLVRPRHHHCVCISLCIFIFQRGSYHFLCKLINLTSLFCGWQGCEREVAEATKDGSDELKNESIMRLSWALVHSKQSEDVQRGIAMLEGNSTSYKCLHYDQI